MKPLEIRLLLFSLLCIRTIPSMTTSILITSTVFSVPVVECTRGGTSACSTSMISESSSGSTTAAVLVVPIRSRIICRNSWSSSW